MTLHKAEEELTPIRYFCRTRILLGTASSAYCEALLSRKSPPVRITSKSAELCLALGIAVNTTFNVYLFVGSGLRKKRTPHRDYRAIAMEMMHRYSRISQEEIGKRFGNLDYSAVSGREIG